MHFKRIRDLREDHDLTQKEVAQILHCTRCTYQKYERGTSTIPVDCLLILCKLYNCSTDYILSFGE